MAEKRDLNDAFLRSVKPPATGRLVLADSRVTGLALRVTTTGQATWSIRTRTQDGRQVRPTLGTYPAIGIADARKKALATLAAVHGGTDPTAARRTAKAAREAREAAPTVEARLELWQNARGRDRLKPWSDRYAAEVARLMKREVLPTLGKRVLVETTRADWTGLVAKKRRTAPVQAAALYRVLASFLGHAEAHGWIPLPLLPRKGATTVAPVGPSRERVLTDAELLAVWRASEAEAPKQRAVIRLLILTAARREEVASIATGEIDMAAATWTIPAGRSKNDRAITLPLHPLAVAELRAVWPEHGEKAGRGWRLLGRIAGNGFAGFGRLKARIDDAAEVSEWRWHDLRRTARTAMARLGVPRDHAEAALNHVSGRTALERTYDRHDYAPEAAAALTRWQAHVAALVAPQPGAEVVPLRRTA